MSYHTGSPSAGSRPTRGLSRRRFIAAATGGLAGAALLHPSNGFAAAEKIRALSVVAHHDDDLLFLSPDLLSAVQQGASVTTIFFNASDYKSLEAMVDREAGVRNAYGLVAGIDLGSWVASRYDVGDVSSTRWQADNGRLTIIELRIPDNGTTINGINALAWRMFANDEPVATRDGALNPAQTLRYPQLAAFLAGVAKDFQPTVVRSLDPYADLHTEAGGEYNGYHRDHVVASRLTALGLSGTEYAPLVTHYRDYSTGIAPANVSNDGYTLKQTAWTEYAKRDPEVTSSQATIDMYDGWLHRQYQVDKDWRGGREFPGPAPLQGAVAGHPYCNQPFRITCTDTGQQLGVFDANPNADAQLITAAPATSDNQYFTPGTRLGGFHLRSFSGLYVKIGPSDGGHPLVHGDESGDLTLQITGDPATGYLLTFGGSGLRATSLGTDAQVAARPPADGDAYQRWTFDS